MTPQIFAAALGIAIIVTMLSALYLLINGRAVVRLFRNDREAGPKVRDAATWRTPRAQVRIALAAFVVGTLACLGIYIFAIDKVSA